MANQFTNRVYPFTREDLEREYLGGFTQYQIAARYGVAQMTIQRFMLRWGIKARIGKNPYVGEDHQSWKGSDAKYAALHLRVQRLRGRPMQCAECGTSDESRLYEWANLTGRLDDPYDYKRMCQSCHRKYDWKRAKERRRAAAAQVNNGLEANV